MMAVLFWKPLLKKRTSSAAVSSSALPWWFRRHADLQLLLHRALFLGYRLAAGFDIFKSSTSGNSEYDYEEQGATVRVTAPITEDLATTLRYTYKQIDYINDGAFGANGAAGGGDDTVVSLTLMRLLAAPGRSRSSVIPSSTTRWTIARTRMRAFTPASRMNTQVLAAIPSITRLTPAPACSIRC